MSDTACTVAGAEITDVKTSLYLPESDTIVLIQRPDMDINDRAIASFTVAHEYGHGVQHRMGIELDRRVRELHADCLAGTIVDPGLVDEASEFIETKLGGPVIVEESPEHVPGMLRKAAFAAGVQGGSCSPEDMMALTAMAP